MKSIKMKITLSILICSLLSSVLIGVLSIAYAGNITNQQAETELNLNCESTYESIDAVVSRIEQSVDILSEIAMELMDVERLQTSKMYVDHYTNELMDFVTRFAENTEGAISVYVRYNPDFTRPTSGIFLNRESTDAEFESLVPTDFTMYEKDDLAHVGWYYLPVENKAPMWMDPYLNENVNTYMISYVVPLYAEDGTSLGIIGMDIDFSKIRDSVVNVQAFETGYAFLTNASGMLIAHPTMETGTDITELGGEELRAILLDSEKEDAIQRITENGQQYEVIYRTLSNGMKIGMMVPYREIQANAFRLAYLIGGFILIAIALSAVLGIIIGRNIANPIKKLTETIKRTAQLDFRRTGQVDKLTKRKDETGTMAKAVSDMRTSLRGIITDLDNAENNILNNVEKLSGIMIENNAISEDNSATTQELAAGMEETTANTNVIAENINGVKQNSQEIRSVASEGEESARAVMERAKMLSEATTVSSDKAMQIYEDMKVRTMDAINKSKAVERINELTTEIRTISSKTNLLALNANIEAARAGDAGRGFAVVATEIGTLAMQTLNTVDGITEIVAEVNGAVGAMTGCIETMMEFMDQTVVTDYTSFREVGAKYEADAGQYMELMQKVYQEVKALDEKIEEIADTIGNVNETISQSAEGVSMIAEKSGEAVSKMLEGAESLNDSKESVDNMKELMEQFKME